MDENFLNDEAEVMAIWSRIAELNIPEEEIEFCEYAQSFLDWGNQLLSKTKKQTVVSINQVKILLLDKFFEWYRYVPRSHRLKMGQRGHICIFQVLVSLYAQLKVIELEITPPMVFEPPPPPPMKILPRPSLAGIVLGEDTDEDES